jgi:hypothetical protein
MLEVDGAAWRQGARVLHNLLQIAARKVGSDKNYPRRADGRSAVSNAKLPPLKRLVVAAALIRP